MSKPITNVQLEGICSQKSSAGNQDTIDIVGDYTVGGSHVINGVVVDGPQTLFDYLDSDLKG